MPMPALNSNAIELHTSVRRSQRDYLMYLAATPGLTKTGTLTELLSYAAAAFLTSKPYERAGFTCDRPEGYYRYVDGKRFPNGDWVALNPSICDIVVDGAVLTSERIVTSLRGVASSHVEKLRSNDTGMNWLVHALITWTISELYPAAKYAPQVKPPKLLIEAAGLPRQRARASR